jgi:glycosyltransferase involved in cell wall biosynthesis
VGRHTDRFVPGARAVPAKRPGTVLAVSPASGRHGVSPPGAGFACGRGRRDVDAVLIGDGPELPRARSEAAGIDGITFTGALPHAQMPACLAAADIGVAPFDTAAHPPLQLAFYWSPLKVFEYMAAGLPVVAPRIPRLLDFDRARRLLMTGRRVPGRGADHLADHDEWRLGAEARQRVCGEFGWAAHCRARRRDPPGDAAAEPVMRVLVATDAFPPVCGGSGWSTYELARGLRKRGHEVSIAQVHAGAPAEHGRSYDGFRILAIEQPAPPVPFVRNYFRNERLWARAELAPSRPDARTSSTRSTC